MSKKDLIEVFGYRPDDLTPSVRMLWDMGACPFINKACIKFNHDKSIIYGTCSVTAGANKDVVICPNRLYANNYEVIKKVAVDAFSERLPFLFYDEYIEKRESVSSCVVALGKNSGKEVQIGKKLSMDWILAKIENWKLIEYIGLEVQSIDITGNYRDAWYGYKNLGVSKEKIIPSSNHGLNWANVHKRLIPQLIRKGSVFVKSSLVKKGLYFVVPEVVYQKFEDVIGADIPQKFEADKNTLSVFTYELSEQSDFGSQRDLMPVRKIHFSLDDFAQRFVSGPNLPSGEELDHAVLKVLGLK